MYKIYHCLLVLLPLGLFAQPVIDNTFLPEIGDNYTFDTVDSNYVLPSAGANQVWDYSDLSFYFTNLSFDFLDPANSPYGSNFSNANISEYQQGGDAYAYYESTLTSYELWGLQTSQNQIVYTDPLTYLNFPITYNDQISDTGTGFLDGGPGTRDSEITAEGYGYGDLILPNQTLNNVLCIKIVTVHTDTYDTSINELLVKEYLFLSPDIPYRILSLISFQDVSSGGDEFSYGYLRSSFVGLPDESLSNNTYKVFPNPVNKEDVFNLKVELKESKVLKFSIIDITGKTIKNFGSKLLSAGTNTILLKSEGLEAGVYFVSMSADDNEYSSTVKLVVK